MNQVDDAEFATRAMARLCGAVPAPGLNHRLLAAYDVAMARRPGWAARLAEILWPGMPAWAPGSALALALLLGIGAGLALPAPAMAERAGFSLADPPSGSVESLMAEDAP